jgi:hypothetical protein
MRNRRYADFWARHYRGKHSRPAATNDIDDNDYTCTHHYNHNDHYAATNHHHDHHDHVQRRLLLLLPWLRVVPVQ